MATDIQFRLQFRLENAWHPVEGDACGAFVFTLVNLSDVAIRDFRLAYTSLTRVRDFEEPFCENAVFVKRNANFHQFAPPAGFVLEPGACWIFRVGGLWRAAKHRTDGAKSAYLTLASGQHLEVAVADLMPGSGESTLPPALLPEGKADHPFAMLPWPALADLVAGDGVPVALYPAEGASLVELRAVENILRLFCRLFAASPAPLSLAPVHQGRAIAFQADAALGASACRLTFSADGITLVYGDVAGLQYALTLLAQILHGARSEPDIFRFPVSGTISDRPRYGWRGCHLDVSRQFYPVADVKRLIDILAWFRMNIFHWHLSDDEAWRLEIKAFAQLTTIGVLRGPDERLLPQLGNGAEPVGGFYTQNEVRDIVAHAGALQIEVVPEIDIPGHSTAMLVALPDLVDRQEPPDSYRSIQGYPNNALNPAIEYTYEVLGKVFDEMVEIFPSKLIHVGGDEVAADTWMASPLARNLMVREGIEGTLGLQSHFMKRIQKMLAERGRNLAGWDEVSHGGGVTPQNTLLMAWQKPEAGLDLARQGYDVVMSPGQAYYLDMVQDEAFQEPGASWAGTVPPKHTYTYEAVAEFPPELADRIKGVQACIWCEHFLNRDHFNHLVFPRLPAIAEAAWTPRENKDWLRFAAIVRLSPRY